MFHFLFKYSPAVFARSSFVLLGQWPVWILIAAILAAAGVLGYITWWRPAQRAAGLTRRRTAVLWLLQASMIAVLLLLLWQPAISVSTLSPQQNVVSVVLDDSRSMSIPEQGGTRRDQALRVLNSGLLSALQQKYQVRLYEMSDTAQRIEKPDTIQANGNATHIGDSLKQVLAEASSLPVGAVVLVSDGAENRGGIDLATMNEIRRYHIPVHTIGIGREQFAKDVEISDAQAPSRVMTDSRVSVLVSFRQRGYSGQKSRISLRDDSRVLASREVTFQRDGVQQTEPLVFDAGPAGVRNLRVTIDPVAGEENANNNSLVRLVNVVSEHPKILYIEGDPRWEFKFIRRAMDDEQNLRLVTMLRTTENKIYRQGIDDPKELEEGFPATPEELFQYQGLIIGDVSAGYFTSTQLDLIKQFVDRRGGGVLFLGGKGTLAEGGYAQSPLADLLPVTLPNKKVTFERDRAKVELTAAGADSLTTRLEEDPQANVERWKKLPELANYQDVGEPKPGAVVLADLMPQGGRRMPLLVMQNYGRGRAAVLATAGTWRWQMQQPVSDRTHEIFWQQLLRWVADSPGHVMSSTPRPVLADEKQVELRAEVRDNKYLPVSDARVHAEITGPAGLAESVELNPDPLTAGAYTAAWTAQTPGGYAANIVATRSSEELGHDAVMFRREDGVAENFHAEQNRELLQKLSSETGGNYYKPENASRLGDEISLSDAGITVREVRDLWNMPAVFLLLLGLMAGEWFLRRKWGVV
jgi:uncharacterized membrane protein